MSFPVPEQGSLLVTPEIAGIKTTQHLWQEGFAWLILMNPSTGLVFDVVPPPKLSAPSPSDCCSPRTCRRCPTGRGRLSGVTTRPDATYKFQIALDRAAQTVTWHVDGRQDPRR